MPSGRQFIDRQQVLFGDVDKGVDVTQGVHEIFVFYRRIPRYLRYERIFPCMQVSRIAPPAVSNGEWDAMLETLTPDKDIDEIMREFRFSENAKSPDNWTPEKSLWFSSF